MTIITPLFLHSVEWIVHDVFSLETDDHFSIIVYFYYTASLNLDFGWF